MNESRHTSLSERARGFADQASAPRLTLFLIVIALLIGVGLGTRIGTVDTGGVEEVTESAAAAPTAALVDAPTIESAPAVSANRTQNVSQYERAVDEALAALSPDGISGGQHSRTVEADESAVSIDSLPLHRPTRETRQTAYYATSEPIESGSASLTLVTTGKIKRGESLGASLERQGISPATVHLIASEMRKVFDFRNSRPGDEYRLGQDSDGRVLDFRYSQNPEESYYLAWEGTRYTVQKEAAELHAQIAKIAGVVESSLYGAIVALGEQSALASEFVRIFAWDIDFSRNVHSGDEFSILYERLYRRGADGEDVYVRPGRILAGRYAGKTGPHTVVYFENEKDGGAYFRPDGTSIERAFLAAPLEFSRISSRFTRARRHPILNVTRPHPGIDYAAPHGTPVYAVAEGVVEYKARAGASGNLIRIRHSGGYTSHYAHLSRFQKSLRIGDRVQQRQVIGYVGSSGLSTGPHVCFRVKKDGHYVDPMKISSPAGLPIDRDQLADFLSVRDQLLASLGPAPVNLVDDAL